MKLLRKDWTRISLYLRLLLPAMYIGIAGCASIPEDHPALLQLQGMISASQASASKESLERPLTVPEDQHSSLDVILFGRTTPNSTGHTPYRYDVEGNLVRDAPQESSEILTFCYLHLEDLQKNYDEGEYFPPGSVGHRVQTILSMYDNREDPFLTQVSSVYEANGVTDIRTTIGHRTWDYLNSGDDETYLRHDCRTVSHISLLAIPRYLAHIYEWSVYRDYADFEPIVYFPFDHLREISVAIDEREREMVEAENELHERFSVLADKGSRETVGSLVFRLPGESFYEQRENVCAVSTGEIDEIAFKGYRTLGNRMLSGLAKSAVLALEPWHWHVRRPNSQPSEPNTSPSMLYIHESLDVVYRKVDGLLSGTTGSDSHCHIVIGFPEDLAKLLSGLKGRHNMELTYPGQLVGVDELRQRYANATGYESYEELEFVLDWPEDITREQLLILRDRGYNRQRSYQQLQEEIVRSEYLVSSELSVEGSIQYLMDLEVAENRGITVLAAREERRLQEQRRAELAAQRRKEERARLQREYPFYAVLTCGLQGAHTAIEACFIGGRAAVETTLEITNGDEYRMYAVYELQQAGQERRDGLNVNLRRNFRIQAQNSASNLLLTLTIYERATGNVLYQRSVQQYGVLSAQN